MLVIQQMIQEPKRLVVALDQNFHSKQISLANNDYTKKGTSKLRFLFYFVAGARPYFKQLRLY